MATLSPEIKKFAEDLQVAYQKELKRAFDASEPNRLADPDTVEARLELLKATRELGSNIPEYAIHVAVSLVAVYLVGDDAGATEDTQMSLPGFVAEERKKEPEPGTVEAIKAQNKANEEADMEARREGDDPDAPENNPKGGKKRMTKTEYKTRKSAATGVADASVPSIQ